MTLQLSYRLDPLTSSLSPLSIKHLCEFPLDYEPAFSFAQHASLWKDSHTIWLTIATTSQTCLKLSISFHLLLC